MPGIIWALFILVICTISPPAIEIPDIFDLFGPDKLVHFFVYATLVILFLRSNRILKNNYQIKDRRKEIVVGAILYGGLIELYQGYFLPNRTCDLSDFIANTIGVMIGVFIFTIIFRKSYGKNY
jgi:VanZ family protein